MIDRLRDGGAHQHLRHLREVARKHRELQVGAEALEDLEHLPQTLGVRHVVGDEESLTHGHLVLKPT